MEFQGELNPIIAERFTDHLDVFGKTMEQMDVIQLMAERCKEALKRAIKFYFAAMAVPLRMLSIWRLN